MDSKESVYTMPPKSEFIILERKKLDLRMNFLASVCIYVHICACVRLCTRLHVTNVGLNLYPDNFPGRDVTKASVLIFLPPHVVNVWNFTKTNLYIYIYIYIYNAPKMRGVNCRLNYAKRKLILSSHYIGYGYQNYMKISWNTID